VSSIGIDDMEFKLFRGVVSGFSRIVNKMNAFVIVDSIFKTKINKRKLKILESRLKPKAKHTLKKSMTPLG